MAFQRGDRVEVMKQEEGFEDSYFRANIISQISNKEYIVQYRTLLNDEGSGPLREFLSVNQLRPEPPEIRTAGFRLSDIVDAYENDGWWVGKIISKSGSRYSVYFKTSDEVSDYTLDLLRVHQDWIDGVWRYSKK